jgi:hypothetical protein
MFGVKSKFRELKEIVLQLPGTHLKDKVVVFESDDWGSQRIPDKTVYNYCLKNGYPMNQNIYTQYDCLESVEDVSRLKDVLNSYSSKPMFTLNMILANPDYLKIKESNFEQYFYKPIDKSISYSSVLTEIKEGIDKGVFSAQFHGREHINVNRWLTALQKKDVDVHFAFDLGMAGIFPKDNVRIGNDMVVALENWDHIDLLDKQAIVKNGLELFEQIFGIKSKSAISCNYVWNDQIEEVYYDRGVELIQSSRFQLLPKGNYEGFNKKYKYTGLRNTRGQIYSVRNVLFEPTYNQDKDWVGSAMKQIERSFKLKKPAIISSHRLNYCSGLSELNRDQSLLKLNRLIAQIQKKWSDVHFCTSDELYKKYLKH